MKASKFIRYILSLLISFIIFLPSAIAGNEPPHWSYGGVTNPTQWGRLEHDFASCEIGSVQSPIDIDQSMVSTPSTIAFHYAEAPLVVANNGHTVQVNYPEGSTVSIDGEDYELLQFHFHTPSEHRLKGRASAMELHLVHRNAAGELAVVGVMLEPGEAHPAIDTVWENLPDGEGTNRVAGIMVNAGDLLPKSTAYFSYTGSLTTPPCSEGVRWNILQEPIQVSEAQIAAFENLYQVNARPIQPTNGRIIQLHEAK